MDEGEHTIFPHKYSETRKKGCRIFLEKVNESERLLTRRKLNDLFVIFSTLFLFNRENYIKFHQLQELSERKRAEWEQKIRKFAK
jgi:hypothetical protein